MKKKSSLLLATIASLLSFDVNASNAPYELFTLAERSENPARLTNDAMCAKLLEDGPIADPRIASHLSENPLTLSTSGMGDLKLLAIGHMEFDDCIAIKTEPSARDGLGYKTLEESGGNAILLSPLNGAWWMRDHFSTEFSPPYFKRTFLALYTDKFVGQIRLNSTNHIMVDRESLMSQDPLRSWNFCIESFAIDLDHHDKGYDAALLVMTASLLKKVAQEASEPASLNTIFDAHDEKAFNAYTFSGFKMQDVVLDQDFVNDDTSSIVAFPDTVSTFSDLTSYFTNTLQVDQSRYMIRAKIDLDSYDAASKIDSVRFLNSSTQ
ncbi:MAG: hypothetical protein K2X53_05845 [Alphaproteobacteria bacterium]|nr:hypothetical protein [Alphaproteobacteria bacterium]